VKIEHLTSIRFMAQIGEPWAVVGQFLPLAKGVNPPEGKFLGTMTHEDWWCGVWPLA
jgi:hypothetical protein